MIVKDAELLRRLMHAADLSARQLARELGWSSHTYLNRILAGEVSQVSPRTAQRLAARLGVAVDLLFIHPQ